MFGYFIDEEFDLEFEDGSMTKCAVLVSLKQTFQPEVFVSDGPLGSIVGDWVEKTEGGIHHIAYQCDIEKTVKEWKELDIEFSSDIIDCPDDSLRQIFTKPLDFLGGIIIELIEKGSKGFCTSNVKQLMQSTKED